jgi:hypothetical protein
MSEPNLKQYELIEDGMFEEIDQDSVILERMALEQSTSSNSDPDDFIFRALKTAKGQNFTFFHHGEDGKETSIVDRQDVFALRGVPIKMRFGYSLFDGGSTNICRTVGAQIGDRRIQTTHPLARPIYSPGLIGDNVSENTPRQEIIALNPIGSRGKSCAECVSSGDHIHLNEPKKEGDPTTPSYCSLQTSVIFCVFEVGILKPELKNGIPYDGVEWIKASEFKNVYAPPTILPNNHYSVINVDGVVNGKKHYNIEVYNQQGQKVEVELDDNTPLEGLTDEQLKNANMLIYQKLANPNQSN